MNESTLPPLEGTPASWPPLPEAPPLTNTELVQLRIRVIAIENLLIALLAQSSDRQRELAHEMAAYILPRPAFTPHPMTLHAATHMLQLLERAAAANDLPRCEPREFCGKDARRSS